MYASQSLEIRADDAYIEDASALSRQLVMDALDALERGDYEFKVDVHDDIGKRLLRLVEHTKAKALKDMEQVVRITIQTNETAVLAANMLYQLQGVEERAQSIAAAAEEMESSVQEIRQYGQDITKESKDAQSITDMGSKAVSELVREFEKIATSVEDNVEKVNQLSGFTKQVSAIAEDIKAIAFQTNLLSLNASVEAARAGEAGKGFAVVAAEVRNLATRSSEATKQIDAIVRKLQDEMGVIIESMHVSSGAVESGKKSFSDVGSRMGSIKESIGHVTENIDRISTTLVEQAKAAGEVAEGITDIAAHTSQNVAGIDYIVDALARIEAMLNKQIAGLAELNVEGKVVRLAQSDHVVWKKRLVNIVVGKEQASSSELTDHTTCRLGKWYGQVRDEAMLHHSSFKALLSPHKLVHEHGKRAIDLYNQGNMQGALGEIAKVEAASKEVLRLLAQLQG